LKSSFHRIYQPRAATSAASRRFSEPCRQCDQVHRQRRGIGPGLRCKWFLYDRCLRYRPWCFRN
jgi:hypothetical protein